ncbi:MAG: dihydroorotase [Planctomycetota bacterium]
MQSTDQPSSPAPTILIRGGRVIDPASGRDESADVALKDGRIAEIGPKLSTGPADHVIDAEGLLVTPGLLDPHVHFREPGQEHKEDLRTGSLAAVAGGFTSVCCMPNTAPALDTPEMIRLILSRAAEKSECRVFPVGCGTISRKGEALAELGLMAEAGAIAFSDDGDAVESADMMRRVLLASREAGRVFMQHCQEPSLTQGSSMHAGSVSTRLGLTGWPRVAEELTLERDIRLTAALAGGPCAYHAQHLSSAGSVELIRSARARGLPVTGEASPHHLVITHEAVAGEDGQAYDTNAKMNPPLREQSDVDALRQGIADGIITILGTDHAPHAPDEKAASFAAAPFGIIGLESALPLYAEALVATGAIDWPRLIALLTIEPARLCGLDARGIGSLAAGGTADVALIDPTIEWTLTESELKGKSRNTPFLGRRLTGRVVTTIMGGRVRHEIAR